MKKFTVKVANKEGDMTHLISSENDSLYISIITILPDAKKDDCYQVTLAAKPAKAGVSEIVIPERKIR